MLFRSVSHDLRTPLHTIQRSRRTSWPPRIKTLRPATAARRGCRREPAPRSDRCQHAERQPHRGRRAGARASPEHLPALLASTVARLRRTSTVSIEVDADDAAADRARRRGPDRPGPDQPPRQRDATLAAGTTGPRRPPPSRQAGGHLRHRRGSGLRRVGDVGRPSPVPPRRSLDRRRARSRRVRGDRRSARRIAGVDERPWRRRQRHVHRPGGRRPRVRDHHRGSWPATSFSTLETFGRRR